MWKQQTIEVVARLYPTLQDHGYIVHDPAYKSLPWTKIHLVEILPALFSGLFLAAAPFSRWRVSPVFTLGYPGDEGSAQVARGDEVSA